MINKTALADSLREIRDNVRRNLPTEPDHAIPHHRADEYLRQTLDEILHEKPMTEQQMRDECIAMESAWAVPQMKGASFGDIAQAAIAHVDEQARRLGSIKALWDSWTVDPDRSQS